MISSLLKNRGLRLQLLVGLLLVLGTFPVPSEGLKCYSCKSLTDKVCRQKTSCPSSDYCFSYADVTDGVKSSGGNCMTNEGAKCYKKKFGDDCVSKDGLAESADAFEKFIDCAARGLTRAQRQQGDEGENSFRGCICNSDYCNTGSSGGHSTSVIISAILTVAFYNHI